MFLQLLANGLVTGSVIAIAAVGVSVVYGILRIVNFAYGDVMAFGAFTACLCNVTWHLPLVPSVVLAMAATALLSVLIELVLWRPLRRRQAGFMSLFLASIGLALVLREGVFLGWGPQSRAYRIDPYKVYVIGSVRLSGAQGAAIVVAAVSIVLVALMLGRTDLGRAMRAMSDDRTLAQVAGMDTRRIIMATWILTGALAALAGVLFGLVESSFDPNFGFQLLSRSSPRSSSAGSAAPTARSPAGSCSGWPWSSRPGAASAAASTRCTSRSSPSPFSSSRCSCGRRASSEGRGSYERRSRAALLGLRRRRRRHLHDVRARSADPVRLHRPAQLRPGRIHGDRRVHDGDPRREGGMAHVARRRRSASSPRRLAGCSLGLPTLRLRADYFAIVTIAFGEIVRYVATNRTR